MTNACVLDHSVSKLDKICTNTQTLANAGTLTHAAGCIHRTQRHRSIRSRRRSVGCQSLWRLCAGGGAENIFYCLKLMVQLMFLMTVGLNLGYGGSYVLPHCMLLHRLSGLQTCGRECLGAHPSLAPGLTMGASPCFDDSVSASLSTGRGPYLSRLCWSLGSSFSLLL